MGLEHTLQMPGHQVVHLVLLGIIPMELRTPLAHFVLLDLWLMVDSQVVQHFLPDTMLQTMVLIKLMVDLESILAHRHQLVNLF